jgi:sugar O-acyltransferase (sialic acid O-acetyltransferase NeuD family)
LLILGTGTFAVEIADLALDIPGVTVAGFVENMRPERCLELLEDRPIYWIDALARLAHSHSAVCGLGTTHRHRFADQAAAHQIPFSTLLHPLARVSSRSMIGDGTIVSVGTIVGARTRIGQHVVLNRGALIGHHTTIGDYVTVGPGANVAGNCRIGNATYIGIGAVVVDHVCIGAHSVVGAGAVVTKDVPDHVQVVGVPAKIVKENIEGK